MVNTLRDTYTTNKTHTQEELLYNFNRQDHETVNFIFIFTCMFYLVFHRESKGNARNVAIFFY